MVRKRLTQTERFAAVILDLKRGNGEPFIARADAKTMTAQQIVDCFKKLTNEAHVVPHAIGGSAHPSNMTIMETEQHLKETRTIDIPQIAQTKRIEKQHAAFRARILAKTDGDVQKIDVRKGKKWPSRPFAKRPDGVKTKWPKRSFSKRAG